MSTEYNCTTKTEYKGIHGFFAKLFSGKKVEQCEDIDIPIGGNPSDTVTSEIVLEHNKSNSSKKLESYYNQITDILEKNGITVEEAKKAKLLEKLVLTEGITEENFSEIKKALEIALGEFSFKHLGKSILYGIKNLFSNDFDIDTLIEETKKELWDIQTKTSILGRKHYDTQEKLEKELEKQGCLAAGESIADGLNTLAEKCKNGEIKETELSRILIDIANSKDIDKSIAVRLIKALTANNRALAIALMQNIDNLSDEELSKVDLEFVKEIKDIALGTANSTEITKAVTYKSFSEMVTDDIAEAVSYMDSELNGFLEENNEKICLAKAKAMRGDELTLEEETYLIYEAMYSSSVVGTCQNTNISGSEARNFIQDILNSAHEASETYNLEFEQDVLIEIVEITQEHPEYFAKRSIKEFTKILDDVTDGKFSNAVAEYKNSKTSYNTEINRKTTKTDSDIEKYDAVNKLSKRSEQENKTSTQKNSEPLGTTTVTNPVKGNEPDLQINKKGKEYAFDTDDINDCAKYGAEGVKAFFAENSDKKAIEDVFTNLDINNSAFVNKAKQLYKSGSASFQQGVLLATGFDGIELLDESRNRTLKDMHNIYANNALVKATEKVIDERKEYNPEYQRYFQDENDKKSCA